MTKRMGRMMAGMSFSFLEECEGWGCGRTEEMFAGIVVSPGDEEEEVVVGAGGGGERKGKKGEGIPEEEGYLGRGLKGGSSGGSVGRGNKGW